jgi:hypothetical protein
LILNTASSIRKSLISIDETSPTRIPVANSSSIRARFAIFDNLSLKAFVALDLFHFGQSTNVSVLLGLKYSESQLRLVYEETAPVTDLDAAEGRFCHRAVPNPIGAKHFENNDFTPD